MSMPRGRGKCRFPDPEGHVNASREREMSISRPGGACQCLEGEGNVDFPTRRGMSMPRGKGKCRFPDPEGHVNPPTGCLFLEGAAVNFPPRREREILFPEPGTGRKN